MSQIQNKQKIIVSYHDNLYIETTIPDDWNNNYIVIHPNDLSSFNYDPELHDIFPWGDLAYDTCAKQFNLPNKGFSKKLSELCNDKYITREKLDSLKDIPYTICSNRVVNWSGDPNDKLIAKPVDGCGSRDLHIVKHGDILPDDDITYIIELYIDDKYHRATIDGYITNGQIGVLDIFDYNFYPDDPMKLTSMVYPSKFIDNQLIYDKYIEVVSELHEKTGCNNQIINIDIFIMDNEVKVMEINPRMGGNYLPIFEISTGYNPWKCHEAVYNGEIPVRTGKEHNGICKFTYLWTDSVYKYVDDQSSDYNMFSLLAGKDSYSQLYIYSETKSLEELDIIANNELTRLSKLH